MSSKKPVWTVLSMIEWATGYFQEKNIPDARQSIEWLLAEILETKRLNLYLQFDRPLSGDELNELRSLVKRRASGEPIQYIIGHTDFMRAKISVKPGVLIPRIETEQLVDLLLTQELGRAEKPVSLLDIGTGSGCIPIALKLAHPNWHCYGCDISAEALAVATENAMQNSVDITFFEGDIQQLGERADDQDANWDVIISNPPYILPDEKAEMHKQVLEFEPEMALFHNSPLTLYQHIIEFAAKNEASLYLECNDKTAKEVLGIAGMYYSNPELKKDLDGNDRFVIATH
ncbi:MAG TPA: peptide chain release factor N(5)-glutamine methyltransferase [Balneolaceae bacterium]|nr:peptide chain release factor N(5)-glutamine methyltransferase [Balneolaceae bacterium]